MLIQADGCQITEFRWTVDVEGTPAGQHTLGGSATERILRDPLPRWSATTAPWASGFSWTVEVRPRVLRAEDPCADALGVGESAAALVLRETGVDPSGARVEHELVVLARYAEPAARTWRAGRHLECSAAAERVG